MDTKKPELVFIPSPGLGHVASAVEISKLILDTDERLSISLLIMKHPADFGVQPYLQSLSSHSRLHFIDISIDSKTAAELLSNKDRFLYDFVDGHKSKVREYVRNNITSNSCCGFVLDMFCISMIDVANEFGVPSYNFFTSATAFLALSLHFEALRSNANEDEISKYDYSESNEELSILGFKNPYPAKILPRPAKSVTPSSILYFDGIRRFKETKGIIINTFVELESFALQSLSNAKIVPQIYPIHPVANPEEGDKKPETESIVKWLDDQPKSSVLFLCFGTLGSFEPEQVREIAIALERSGQRFLWSLRRPPPKGKVEMPRNYENSDEVLPEGFLDRTNGIGKVVGWAPQVTVLSHPAVGGFVSHCGWNSVLESVCCGVPIAAWPLYAEQQMNGFLLVKELGLAVEIRLDYVKDFEGKNPVDIVTAEEIEGAIKKLMADGEENEVRKKVKEMQEKSRIAMEEGGSSYTSLRLLIEDFISNISQVYYWPMYSEQQANAFQLVKDLGMGMDIKMDYKIGGSNADIIKAEEIESAIRQLMEPENEIRMKVKDMKEKSRLALKEGGTSYISVGRFIEVVGNNLIMGNHLISVKLPSSVAKGSNNSSFSY